MGPKEITALIQSEIAGNWSQSNDHGVDLKSCLVTPRKVLCRNTFPKFNRGESLELWIVLEETPQRPEGYLIVFDDERHKFGLACWSGEEPTFIGYYGTFLSSLASM